MIDSFNGDLFSTPEDYDVFPDGFHFLPGCLDVSAQNSLITDVRKLLAEAPLFQQRMPRSGAPLSVQTSNAGEFGWVTDCEKGYRYEKTHPLTCLPWPTIPDQLLALWTELTDETMLPNQCLVNFYNADAKLGLHQDLGKSSMQAPVLSVSLGDEAIFMVGGATRQEPTQQLSLRSGDVLWFGGKSRLIFHGVKGILPGTSELLENNGLSRGRINLTLRRVENVSM